MTIVQEVSKNTGINRQIKSKIVKEDNRNFITVALNELDDLEFQEFKVLIGEKKDSSAMKIAVKLAKSVTHGYCNNGLQLNLLKMKASDLRKIKQIQQKRNTLLSQK